MAGPGDLDRSFAPGVVMTPLGEIEPVTAMGVFSDGRVVVAGRRVSSSPDDVYRYRSDGTPDHSFGAHGLDPSAVSGSKVFEDILVQADNKVVFITNSTGLSLIRQNEDGTFDQSFGQGGTSVLAEQAVPEGSMALAQGSDGKTVIMSTLFNGETTRLRRLNVDGSLDLTFGVTGIVSHGLRPRSLAVQPDGKILVVGSLPEPTTFPVPGIAPVDMAIIRFLPDGILDTSFGIGGVAKADQVDSETFLGVTLQADGRIVVVGNAGSGQIVTRWNTDGTLDATFGSGGYAPSPFSGSSIAIQSILGADGRMLIIGRHQQADTSVHHHVVCYHSDGSIHGPYANGGVAFTGLLAGGVDYSYGITRASSLADGRLVIGAEVSNEYSSSFVIVRLLADGTRDESYGGGMLRITGSGLSAYLSRSSLGKIALQPDGGILFPSVTSYTNGSPAFAEVHAFTSDGRPQTTFGTAGVLQMTGPVDSQMYGSQIILRPDGRFVLGGRNITPQQWSHSQRLPGGAADAAFNSGSVAVTSIGTTSSTFLNAMLPDGSGRIVSYGHLRGSGSNQDFILTRHLADGSLDPTFGQNGVVSTSVGVYDSAAYMVILPDGRILVGGGVRTSPAASPSSAVLVRYLPDGGLDPSFGAGGVISTVAGLNASVNGLTLLPDGRFLAALVSGQTFSMPILARFMPTGILDPTFGNSGISSLLPAGLQGNIRDVLLQKDGRIVTVGEARPIYGTNPFDAMVARYEPDGSLDLTFGQAGARLIPIASALNRAQRAVIQPDNRIVLSASGTLNGTAPSFGLQSLIRLDGGPLLANLRLGAPADRSESGVRLSGSVNPNGFATTALFEFGPTSSYGQSVPLTLVNEAGTEAENVEAVLSGLMAGTTYHYRLTATTSAGSRSTPDSTFSTFSSLEVWRQSHFGSAANTGASADTSDLDLDGLPNLLEWACGLVPSQTSRLQTAVASSGGIIEFTYPRDTSAVGAVYAVEWSDTLPGTAWSTTGVSETVLGQAGTIQTIKATLPAGTQGNRFVRLRVQGPP